MRKSINIILKKNILIILLMISMCPVLGFSYARFVINTDSYRSNEMYMAELLYTVKIDDVSTYTLSIPKGESEHIIEITSIDMIGSNYKLIYQDNSNVKVEYASDYQDPAFGGILTKRTIMLRLINNSEVNQTLSFNVVGGYSFNSLDEIIIPSGYTEVKTEYWKYDYETTALYVNNVRVESLDTSKYYNLDSYTCTNGAIAKYNLSTRKLSIDADVQTKCSLYFVEYNPLFTFDYTGTEQTLVTTASGYYKLEVWGAQGGNYGSTVGGYGGYSVGTINLQKNTTLYIYVGGTTSSTTGGYNGGGKGVNNDNGIGRGGGGATHIATTSGSLASLGTSKGELSDNGLTYESSVLIIVGAGGGGVARYNDGSVYTGGSAGGYKGSVGTRHGQGTAATAGTQKGGNAFGLGANGLSGYWSAGGGAGFYGGGSGRYSGGAGGSSYIGNPSLTDKAMYCYNCSTSSDINIKTISNTCNNSTATENCSKSGNGYAKITYIGTENSN